MKNDPRWAERWGVAAAAAELEELISQLDATIVSELVGEGRRRPSIARSIGATTSERSRKRYPRPDGSVARDGRPVRSVAVDVAMIDRDPMAVLAAVVGRVAADDDRWWRPPVHPMATVR